MSMNRATVSFFVGKIKAILYPRVRLICDYVWFFGIAVIIVAIFFVVNPHFVVKINPNIRKKHLSQFIQNLNNGRYDEQQWWQLRDSYSPGYFTYNSELISPYSILQFNHIKAQQGNLINYYSSHITSSDNLVPCYKLKDMPKTDIDMKFTDEHTMLYSDQKGNHLIRLVPAQNLNGNNGLIQFDEVNPDFGSLCWETKALLN